MAARNDTWRVRISGAGGHGIMLAGHVLAEAAALYDGKNVCQTKMYGPEARGGSSRTDVIISTVEIDSPVAATVDVLLAFNQEACDKYFHSLREGGVLLVDSLGVQFVPTSDAVALPLVATARVKFNMAVVANMIALGSLVQLTGVVSRQALDNAVRHSVRRHTEVNLQALAEGYRLAKEFKRGL